MDPPEMLTVAQILDEVAERDLLDLRIAVERDGKDLVLTPEILAMFFPDENGRLHPLIDTSGEITEVSAGQISSDQAKLRWESRSQTPSFDGPADDETESWRCEPKVGLFQDIVLSGGSKANHQLHPGLAGFYGGIWVHGLWSDTADTYTLAFQDEDDAACTPINPAFSVTVPAAGDFVLLDLILRGPSDAKAIEVDVGGGGGTEELNLSYDVFYGT